MQLTQVALEQVLSGVGVHVANEVLPVLEGLIADSALVRAVSAMSALVVRQVRRLTEALLTGVAFVRLLTRVHALVPRELGQVSESLGAHRTLVGPVGVLKSSGRRGAHCCSAAGGLAC